VAGLSVDAKWIFDSFGFFDIRDLVALVHGQRSPQGRVNGFAKAFRFFRIETLRAASRVNPREKKRFGDLDVAEPRDDGLIHEHVFDGAGASAQFLRQGIADGRVPCVRPELGERRLVENLGERSHDEATQLPRIPIVHDGSIAPSQPRVRPFGRRFSRRYQFEFAGHPQVSEKAELSLEMHEQPFAAALDGQHAMSRDPFESGAPSAEGDARPIGFCAYDELAAEPSREARAREFHFRKLGHTDLIVDLSRHRNSNGPVRRVLASVGGNQEETTQEHDPREGAGHERTGHGATNAGSAMASSRDHDLRLLRPLESRLMRRKANLRVAAAVFVCAIALLLAGSSARAGRVVIPLVCSRGNGGHSYEVSLTAPSQVASGSVFTVRIDGANSGKISHAGLNYVHDMTYEYLVPSGTGYVESSARIVDGTGSPNVRSGARVSHADGVITLFLPARVEDGSSYTPPTFEFQLRATALPGAVIAHSFAAYRVTANAFLVGDLKASCDPTPKPYPVGVTRVKSGEQ
jgi:hypothetical protein